MGTFVIKKKKVAPVAVQPAATTAKVKPPKAKISTEAQVAELSVKEKVDKIIELHQQVEAAKKPKKDYDGLRKELLELVEPDYAATEEILVTGTKGAIKFTAKSENREVLDYKAVHTLLGDDAFYKLVSITMGNIDKYLTAVQQEKLVKKSMTGSRGYAIVPKSE